MNLLIPALLLAALLIGIALHPGPGGDRKAIEGYCRTDSDCIPEQSCRPEQCVYKYFLDTRHDACCDCDNCIPCIAYCSCRNGSCVTSYQDGCC